MTEPNPIHKDNASTSSFKGRRLKASLFFKKTTKQEESPKNETIRKLEDENRKLRQKLEDANSRIRKMELRAKTIDSQIHDRYFSTERATETETFRIQDSPEHRDDDVDISEDIKDETDNFSIEVEASTVGSFQPFLENEEEIISTTSSSCTTPTRNDKKSNHYRKQHIQEQFLKNDEEIISVTSSACTTPTGNDQKSNNHRKQHQWRQPLQRSNSSIGNIYRRGENAYVNYFSRRSSPLERIAEIDTQRSLFDDISSTTSDLTASVASSTEFAEFADDESINASSLMSGRRIPLRTMKSLLRISYTESESNSYVPDDESVLFGEI